jgi:hypothetical protein
MTPFDELTKLGLLAELLRGSLEPKVSFASRMGPPFRQ